MLMKKIVSLALALLLVFTLASCTGGNEEITEDNGAADSPVISLVCDNTVVSAGEEIAVKVNISNAPLTACFDIYVISEDTLTYASSPTSSEGLILVANNDETAEDGGRVIIRGMVASTYDVLDDNICTVKYTVSEDAVSGSKIK